MKSLLAFFLIGLSFSLQAQNVKTYQCLWHQQGSDDFTVLAGDFKYSDKGKYYFLITNDKENIHVLLKIQDEKLKRQIMMGGLTTWINIDGKKSKKLGVKFPAGRQGQQRGNGGGSQNPSEQRDMQDNQNRPDRRNQGREANPQDMMPKTLTLIGFSESEQFVTNPGESDIRGAMRIQPNQTLYYEVIIPFSKLPAINNDADTKSKKGGFVLGLSYEGSAAPGAGGRPGGAGGGMPSGSGGGGRGGSRGGSTGAGKNLGGGAPTGQPSVPIILWLEDIKLADQK